MIQKKYLFIALIFCLAEITLLSSCQSQYHWVKVKSLDPMLLNKEDASTKIMADSLSSNLAALNLVDSNKQNSQKDHGKVSISDARISLKAREIVKSLSPERKEALHSTNKETRLQAIQETLHEQLIQNKAFTKLSASRQAKIEKALSKKMANGDLRSGVAGINNLLLLGLILLVVSIIFFALPGVGFIGVLFDVVAAVLIILGLVEMLG